MRKRLSFFVAAFVVIGGVSLLAATSGAARPEPQAVASQIIAREKAAFEAWQKKDKAFYVDFLADDATYFGAMNPYLETDPKTNFLPKFEQYTEMFKYLDW